MKASDVMTRQVITIRPDATIVEAARLLLQKQISGLPVVNEKGKLVGIVTEGDFLRRVETATEKRRAHWLEFLIGPGRIAEEYVHSHGRKVEEVMTYDPVTVKEDTTLETVVHLMERHHIKRLPVVSDDHLVGIISRANLLNALASLAREAAPTTTDDATIRNRVLAAIEKQPWSGVGINVVVRDGNLELSGVIFDERQRQALRVAAENVPGVKTVHDHLASVEPVSGLVLASPEDIARHDKTI